MLSKKKIIIETNNLSLGLTGHFPDIDLCDPNSNIKGINLIRSSVFQRLYVIFCELMYNQ